MIKSFKQHNIDKNKIINKNEKMLLWNNLEYKNGIYQKKGKKMNDISILVYL